VLVLNDPAERSHRIRKIVAGLAPPLGRAVQVEPIKPMLKASGTRRLKMIYDDPLSNFAFKFNLHHYSWARRRVHTMRR
jgi:hypothetical protein